MAKHYQIKIYSIGVGSSRPFAKTQFGFEFIRDFGFDPLLLKKISSETGGQYFHAKNPKELKTVYEKIDALEKRDIELDIYSRYYEFFWPFFIMACCLVFAEAVLTSLFWKGIAW
jgi:Ca-activated chloride channel family protein